MWHSGGHLCAARSTQAEDSVDFWKHDSFGAAVYVALRSMRCGAKRVEGRARIDGVRFVNCGGDGAALNFQVQDWLSCGKTRPEICWYGLLAPQGQPSSFVRGSVFEQPFSGGIAFGGSTGVEITRNIVVSPVGPGIAGSGFHNQVVGNLVAGVTYADEAWESTWAKTTSEGVGGGADGISVSGSLHICNSQPGEGRCQKPDSEPSREMTNARNEVRDNVVAGTDGVGFRLSGEPCDAAQQWISGNLARACAIGLKGRPTAGKSNSTIGTTARSLEYPALPDEHMKCTMLSDFTVARALVYGANYGGMGGVHQGSMKFRRLTTIDAGVAASAHISTTPANTEELDRPDRHFAVELSRIVGGNYRCHQIGVVSGIFYTTMFEQSPNWKKVPHPTKLSGTLVKDTELIGFGSFDRVKTGYYPYKSKAYTALRRCRTGHRNYALALDQPPGHHAGTGPDQTPVIEVSGVTTRYVPDGSRFFFAPAPLTGLWGIGDTGCAQFACDGLRNGLVIDMDGSLLGGSGGTAFAANERWFEEELRYIDPLDRHTMRDLIPYTALENDVYGARCFRKSHCLDLPNCAGEAVGLWEDPDYTTMVDACGNSAINHNYDACVADTRQTCAAAMGELWGVGLAWKAGIPRDPISCPGGLTTVMGYKQWWYEPEVVNHHVCVGGRHRQLVFEDLNPHGKEVRVAPLSVTVSHHVSLLTGPKNYIPGGYNGVPHIERLNWFWARRRTCSTDIVLIPVQI